MSYELTEDERQLRDSARRLLQEKGLAKRRSVFEGEASFDEGLWREIAGLGWLGAALPESYGGVGLGYVGLCALAEELGRSLAPVPFSSSIQLAAEAILVAGTDTQKRTWLPKLASGDVIGTVAWAEGTGSPDVTALKTTYANGKLSGHKHPVVDGRIADIAIVVTQADSARRVGLQIVGLMDAGVKRSPVASIDPGRPHAALVFDNAVAETLGAGPVDERTWNKFLDRAAILTAFEQVGGAQACLDMALAYAKEREAFGRPIGSFQAVKHRLADMYVAVELARSNARAAAVALAAESADLGIVAATARLSAMDAFLSAATDNILVHGGIAVTWQSDCHLYYRRAQSLALALGGRAVWEDRLIEGLDHAMPHRELRRA